MANTVLTPDIIARESVMILENNLTVAKLFYRGYEDEFDSVNGYKVGDTVRIARPTDFTVRDGATASIQDVVEGSLPFTVNKQKGIDFQFTSKELTLNIGELSERVIKPAMIQVANQIDRDGLALFDQVYNWVGTPTDPVASPVNSFSDIAKAGERLDWSGVPTGDRNAILSPTDAWGLLGAQTALYMNGPATDAYRRGDLGMIANINTYSSQNVQSLTTGTRTSTGLINGSQSTTWASTRTAGTMSLSTDGWGTTTTLKDGEVFTIAGVFAVNPVTKATLNYLQQFVVIGDTTSTGAGGGTATLTISPPIITTGAFQTVSAAPADNATMTIMGTASTVYPQNMVFAKNAFGLVVVPMIKPPGAVDVARRTYRGVSVRVIPYYSGSNDVSAYRLDVLYGVKAIDPRQATRLSGS
jgi:hypothetical protein